MAKRTPPGPRRAGPKLTEAQYRTILDTINDALHVMDRDLRIVFINSHFKRWCRKLGIPPIIIGRSLKSTFPFLAPQVYRQYRTVFRTKKPLVTREITPVGARGLWTETQKIPILAGRRVIGVVTVIHDISPLKTAEEGLRRLNRELDQRVRERTEQLRLNRTQLASLLEHLPVGVYRTTPGGRLLQANPVLARMLGYSSVGEILKVDIRTRYANPGERSAHLRALQRRREESREFQLRRKDGSPVWVRDHPKAVRDPRGRILHFDGVLVDISSRKNAERALEASRERYRDLVDNANSIILIMDTRGRITYWNRFAERFFGFKTRDVSGRCVVGTIVPPRDSSGRDLRAMIADICRRPARYANNVNENMKKSGERVWIAWTNRPLLDEDGTPGGVLCIGNDLTRIKKAEDLLRRSRDEMERRVKERTRALMEANRVLKHEIAERAQAERVRRESEERFREFFNANVAASYICTPRGRFVQCNEAFLRLFGFKSLAEAQAVPGSKLYDSPSDRRVFLEKIRARRSLTLEEMAYRTLEGSHLTVLENAVGIFDSRGRLKQILGYLLDVTQLKDVEERLSHLLQHDLLTGLPNRGLLLDRMEQALGRARRGGRCVGLLVLDLDHFNTINDTMGHVTGDRLLQGLARRLSVAFPDSDGVAHLGGDEFTLLFSDLGGPEKISDAPSHLREMLAHPFPAGEREVYASASVGIAFFPQDALDAEGLLKNAEVAMFQAKEQGGDHTQYYRPEMNVMNVERLMLETSLRKALERNEFRLHYQPLVDLRTRRILGLEALIRWHHPELGLLYPAQFISLAEEKGLIVPIGEWVLRQACVQFKEWLKRRYPLRYLSVNLSARQFRSRGIVDVVERTLGETGMPPGCLELELTENMIMDNLTESVHIMHELKKLGVRLAIDDFGTGYSSLFYLKKHFPLDTLKIDRYFLKDVAVNADDAAIVQAIITLGRSLRLNVVAEGVETPEQLAFLRSTECDMMQGFLCSKALRAEDLTPVLREGRCPAEV
jgi:diguanylate cyclase (GGDEF)-like protein/PAS domain S-box-containing protein